MLVSSSRMRKAEILADNNGIPATVLMENAAAAAVGYICEHHQPCRAAVVCGSGNNGGDGFLVAAGLLKRGFDAKIILAFDTLKSDAASLALSAAEKAGAAVLSFSQQQHAAVTAICDAELLVDAVFGIGFSGSLEGEIAALTGFCNTAHAFKYALDLPSGCNGDTATADKNSIRADVTLCFGAYKPGNLVAPACRFCGRTVLLDIGIDPSFYGDDNELCLMDEAEVRRLFPVPRGDTYKNREGRLLILAGQPGMVGAAKLAASSAVRSGVGLVELMTDKRIAGSISAALTLQLTDFYTTDAREPMASGAIGGGEIEHIVQKAKKANAVAAGCGWGYGIDRAEVVSALIARTELPILLDADALSSVANRREILRSGGSRLLLTPHLGEFCRLSGADSEELAKNKLTLAKNFAAEYGVTLLLKGPDTLVTDGERLCVVTAGSPCMAKGGSGDVLSGVAGALLAKGLEPIEAGAVAAWCCGTAGELAAEKFSVTAATPLDTIDRLCEVYRRIER